MVPAAAERAQRNRAHGANSRADAATDQTEARVLLTLAEQQADGPTKFARRPCTNPIPDERLEAAAHGVACQDSADLFPRRGEALHDSAERREQAAADLEAQGVKGIAARVAADVSQAHQPPTSFTMRQDRGQRPPGGPAHAARSP